MNLKVPIPNNQFREVAEALRIIKERGEVSSRWHECKMLVAELKRPFRKAFGLSEDRTKVGYKFFLHLKNSQFDSELPSFRHLSYFKHNDEVVIVSQP